MVRGYHGARRYHIWGNAGWNTISGEGAMRYGGGGRLGTVSGPLTYSSRQRMMVSVQK